MCPLIQTNQLLKLTNSASRVACHFWPRGFISPARPRALLTPPGGLAAASTAFSVVYYNHQRKDLIMATVRELKATARPKSGRGRPGSASRRQSAGSNLRRQQTPPLPLRSTARNWTQRILAGRFLDHSLRSRNRRREAPRYSARLPARLRFEIFQFMSIFSDWDRTRPFGVRIPIHVTGAEQSPGVKRWWCRQHRDTYA